MKTIGYILAMVSMVWASCTNSLYKRGVRNYDKMAYYKAIGHLEKYTARRDEPVDAKLKRADAYRQVNDAAHARQWYAKVVSLPESPPINQFYYARLLMENGEYEEAKIWFSKYLEKAPDDYVAELLLVSCCSLKSFREDTTLFTVKEAVIPDVATAFAQVPFRRGLVFTADKVSYRNATTADWTGRSYLDLYYSEKNNKGNWQSPVALEGKVNGPYHEGPACFNESGDVMYFTRSNYLKKKKMAASTKRENNLQLFRAELIDGEWTNVNLLPFNSSEYSCGHPSLSVDGKTLYFISDMPGGMGGTDIYKATFDGQTWSKPENLGSSINTPGDEMFPYMHKDGTFYFSSDAHTNLGGLDVFMSSWDGNRWLQAENLNYPLNTSKDDFAFVLNADNRTGYVSSNRNRGDDHIYEVTRNDPTFVLSGKVSLHTNAEAGIDSAVVEIENLTEQTTERVITDARGNYTTHLKVNSAYRINSWKPMYFTMSDPKMVSVIGKKHSENFVANFSMAQIIIEKPIVLQNIYYDLDKWDIRPDAASELDKLVQVMNDNPNLVIELGSHTDSRAGDQYNMVLSTKRAKAAIEYIASKGIEAKRLRWKGYGESRLVNHCTNGVECSEAEHQQNRRTEFKAIKPVHSFTNSR